MKTRILYYSDCPFFAGCENMLANFLNSDAMRDEYEILFVYRKSNAYEEGLKRRVRDCSCAKGIPLLVPPRRDSWVASRIPLLAMVQLLLWPLVRIASKYYLLFRNASALQRVFNEFSPEIVHVNNGGYPAAETAQSAVLAAGRCGVSKIVYVVNNLAMGYGNPLRWLDRLMDPIISRKVTRFVTGSENAARRLCKVLGLRKEQVKVIHNGIQRRKVGMPAPAFRRLYGLDPEKRIVSVVANLEKRKGHRYLLEAIAELSREGRLETCQFVFEGRGPEGPWIRDYIRTHGLEKTVRMITVENIYDLYNVTDLLVLPSVANEDFPNTIIEAMAMGIPVVGTRIAGIPEQIEDGVNGLLVDPRDVGMLRTAIVRFCEDESFRERCAVQARQSFERQFRAQISVEAYRRLYEEL